jgi:hypothetical protein
MFLFREQSMSVSHLFADHHDKRLSRQSVGGERQAPHRLTMANGLCQPCLAVATETTSYDDPACVERPLRSTVLLLSRDSPARMGPQ